MAVTPRYAALALSAMVACGTPLAAQSITSEADVTAGISNQEVRAVATQVRGFGEAIGVRYFVEVAMAAESATVETDAFSGAYPYETGTHVIEAYGERLVRAGTMVMGARAGRFRTPFGLYNRGDHAYAGFFRAPLIRYDGYWAVSNNYLEHGGAGFIGTPHLLVEASVGAPADVGVAQRRTGVDTTVRAQGFAGPFIVGVSHIRTQPFFDRPFVTGRATFTGVDGRWMAGGILVRGEWLYGQSYSGTSTDGGYLDVSVHRPRMGPVTAVFRTERLSYDTIPAFALHARRETLGARVRLFPWLTAQVNVAHQTAQVAYGHPVTVDVGATDSVRR